MTFIMFFRRFKQKTWSFVKQIVHGAADEIAFV